MRAFCGFFRWGHQCGARRTLESVGEHLRDRRAGCGPDKGGIRSARQHLAVSTCGRSVRPPGAIAANRIEQSPAPARARFVAQVYQGGHVDIYLECADTSSGRVLARLSGPQAAAGPIGAPVGLSLNADEAIAFRGRLAAVVCSALQTWSRWLCRRLAGIAPVRREMRMCRRPPAL